MAKIIGKALPNMPWQDKPAGYEKPVWRYDQNPIIPRDLIPTSNSIFNSAVVPFNGAYAGVFRCDSRALEMDIFAGFSEDGINWSKEVVMVKADMQYYCKVVPTTQDGLVRVCMYSNPTSGDARIRMGFLDLNTGTMYNADGKTALGKEKVSYLNFDILIDVPAGKVQRMFDVAISDPQSPRILYTTFSNDKNANDSEYYIYDSGKSVKICNGGVPLWNPKYQGGASFAGDDCIVVARNASGTDYIEVYDYVNGTVKLSQSVYSQKAVGNNRNARPIVDVNGRAFL